MNIYETFLLNCDFDDNEKSKFLSILKSAPRMYKIYTIPKRTHGYRVIAHPAKDVKFYQRNLNSILSKILCVHESAYAYRQGRSIKDNAIVHKDCRYLLKMDFANFFNSITPEILFLAFNYQKIILSELDKYFLTQMIFWNPSKSNANKLMLSVGAPTSPLISNFIMNQFDEIVHGICASEKIRYSRYADDIFFSTNIKNILFDMPRIIRNVLSILYGTNILINENKTVFSSKAHNRHVTGVTISNSSSISLGRDRKRYISSLVHKFTLGILSNNDIERLKGLLSFSNSIEEAFLNRLEKKYSKDTIKNIYKSGL